MPPLNTSGWDGFVAKADPDGEFQWFVRIGGDGGDGVRGLAVDGFGNVAAITVGDSPTITVGDITLNGPYAVHYSKIDAAGQVLWAVTTGQKNIDQSFAITSTLSGIIYGMGTYFNSGQGTDAKECHLQTQILSRFISDRTSAHIPRLDKTK